MRHFSVARRVFGDFYVGHLEYPVREVYPVFGTVGLHKLSSFERSDVRRREREPFAISAFIREPIVPVGFVDAPHVVSADEMNDFGSAGRQIADYARAVEGGL